MDQTDGTLVFSLPLFLMQVKPGSMAPCYNNNYDNDTDGDDSDTAHCYTSNSSDVAAFRRSCCTFRRWHKHYKGNRVHLHIQQQFTCTGDRLRLRIVMLLNLEYILTPECTGIEPLGCLMVQNCLRWQKLLETCPTTILSLKDRTHA